MNPLFSSILGGLVRMLLGGVVGWLIQQGIMQPDQTPAFYGAVTTAIAGIAWVIWKNVIAHRLLNTAAAMPPTSIEVVKAMVRDGVSAPANSPSGAVPNLPPVR